MANAPQPEVVGHEHRFFMNQGILVLTGVLALIAGGAGAANYFVGEGDFLPDFADGLNEYEIAETAAAAATIASFVWFIVHTFRHPQTKSVGHPIVRIPEQTVVNPRKISVK